MHRFGLYDPVLARRERKLSAVMSARHKTRMERRGGRGSNASTKRSATPGRYTASEGVSSMLARVQRDPGAPAPFSRMKRVTLRYADQYQITSTSGVVASQVWRLNALYDPDFTNTGHQPLYYDQFISSSGPYSQYVVTGARVALKVSNIASPAGAITAFAMGPSTVSTSPPRNINSIPAQAIEIPGWTGGLQNGYADPEAFKFQFDIAKLFGITQKQLLAEDDYSAAYNANPNNVMYFQLICAALNGETCSINVTAEFEFDCVFRQLTSLQSES